MILSDAVAEGRLAFHPRDFYASHRTQSDACGPYIEQYGGTRLPKYYAYLEACLEWNAKAYPAGSGGGAGGGGGGGGGGTEGQQQQAQRQGGDADAGDAGGGWLVGPRLTVADLTAYHFVCAAERHYGRWHAAEIARAPRLGRLRARVAARPRVAAYLASDRCPPFDADSMM